jgi:predicted transcriptional regulator
MILEPEKTFSLWISKVMKELNIHREKTAMNKAGIHFHTMNQWAHGYSMPRMFNLIRLTETLAKTTGESPQDILDTIMESIPEWRRINGK